MGVKCGAAIVEVYTSSRYQNLVLLSSGRVNQCFGAFNKFTESHEKILRIMKENMDLIMKAV